MGSAKEGVAHWWAQRVSAVALTVKIWLGLPISSLLALLLVTVLFYHSYLGTSVIVEDYVHAAGAKLLWLLALRFLYVLAGAAALFAILRVAFGS